MAFPLPPCDVSAWRPGLNEPYNIAYFALNEWSGHGANQVFFAVALLQFFRPPVLRVSCRSIFGRLAHFSSFYLTGCFVNISNIFWEK